MDYVSEKKLALLIDAENISYKYISTIKYNNFKQQAVKIHPIWH